MLPSDSGSFRFFRFSGIQVYVHWSWFLVAWIEISARRANYASPTWNIAEYLAIFLIVLLHEFGHAFACRQVGGQANEIVLWPLGGVAYVRPPSRPGAELWSIAAGPLVNVVLVPVLFGVVWFCRTQGWIETEPDLRRFLADLIVINFVLLAFNLLPIYPLDGGQILRSLLWFGLGRGRSLQVASIIGFLGVAALVGLAFWQGSIWMGIMALFVGHRCYVGFRSAQAMLAVDRLPRHSGFACAACGQPPPSVPVWLCAACGHRFDAFATRGVCPHCQTILPSIACVHCGAAHPFERWEKFPGRRPAGEAPVIDV